MGDFDYSSDFEYFLDEKVRKIIAKGVASRPEHAQKIGSDLKVEQTVEVYTWTEGHLEGIVEDVEEGRFWRSPFRPPGSYDGWSVRTERVVEFKLNSVSVYRARRSLGGEDHSTSANTKVTKIPPTDWQVMYVDMEELGKLCDWMKSKL